jgi:hypothetical protein
VNRWVASGQLVPFVTTGAGHLYLADDIRALAERMPPKEKTPT